MNELQPERLVLPILELSQVGDARRMAMALAGRCDFNESDTGRVAIVVTELARNLVLHAGGGELIVQIGAEPSRDSLEILALDKGPGMADIDRCLRDGYSTAGTPGTGLGSVTRLSDLFEIDSRPGMGTAILSRIRAKSAAMRSPFSAPQGEFEVGVVNLPYPGEVACGDAWAVRRQEGRTLVMVADGLGHGPLAAEAANEMLQVFESGVALRPGELIEAANGALRATRGAAVAVAAIDPLLGQVCYAGIGNIAGVILDSGQKGHSMVSHNGTVGLGSRRIQEYFYAWAPDSLLIMHSDGLTSHWSLDRYPGLTRRHPTLIAGVLYRDYARGRDDVTVLAARQRT